MELCSEISGTSSQSEIKKSQSVATLLESFRALKRREFQPNVKALQNLMNMGYSEESTCEALCVTGNSQSAAVRIVSYSYS
jgi:uncharacterized UBP type Zn finger protein